MLGLVRPGRSELFQFHFHLAETVHEVGAHPFDWAKGQVPDRAWTSWFRQLDVEPGEPITITAPTQFALDHVKAEYGPMLRRHYGAVAFGLKRKA